MNLRYNIEHNNPIISCLPMKHSSTTSPISSLMFASMMPAVTEESLESLSPRPETICALQVLARTYTPAQTTPKAMQATMDGSEKRWFDEHAFAGEAI